MDDWVVELRRGNSDGAWDLFVARYRRIIFAAIRHYAREPDDVMDVFASVCEALREDDLRRLRSYLANAVHRASFSTWLVAVVHNLTIDWLRHRDGRPYVPVVADGLTAIQRSIFEHIYLDCQHHVAAYELIHARAAPDLTFGQFLAQARATHLAVTEGRRGQVGRSRWEQTGEEPTVPPSSGETGERRTVLKNAVATLDTGDRLAVNLYVVDEQPAATVATLLGLPNAKAVYNRVYRALGVLRERLAKAGIRRGDL